MDGSNTDKKYESFKIPDRNQIQKDLSEIEFTYHKSSEPASLDEGQFYEIEYDSCPMPGVGRFVLKPQKIEPPKKDETRELFERMREISRSHRSRFDHSRFFDPRVQQDNGVVFYKQGVFMKDFTDNYSGNAQFNQYFPYYQMMGYEQLRTYFTWRTEVRKGNMADISLSYAYLYMYELLSNIGVSDPEDGLNQLMTFWKTFSSYNKSIDKYVLKWLKDYHIYYELPHSFKDFIDKNNLTEYYPKILDKDNNFELFCTISKYDIRKSTFFLDGKEQLIRNCFYFILNRLRQIFVDCGIDFDEEIFHPTKKMSVWKPFKEALFYQWMKQDNRHIVLSENEMYICDNNKWSFNTAITSDSGRQLIGYIMKQMESELRQVMQYKYKLSVNMNGLTHEAVSKLNKANVSLDIIIKDAVTDFYKEETKIVVTVDQDALSRIRQDAQYTQEKLVVPEGDKQFELVFPTQERNIYYTDIQDKPVKQDMPIIQDIPQTQDMIAIQAIPSSSYQQETETPPTSLSDTWESLKNTLTPIEIKALSIVLHGEEELKKYADECGIMLEVLVDGINEKAMDFIGDNLLDEEFVLYDDYKELVKELIG